MHLLSIGANLLAEQSIFAQLMIKRKPAIVSQTQRDNDKYYTLHDESTKLNSVDTDEYSITNLPPLFSRLPVNSIYDRILFVSQDSPDFRFVNVDNGEQSRNATVIKSIPASSSLQTLDLNAPLSRTIQNAQSLFLNMSIAPSTADNDDDNNDNEASQPPRSKFENRITRPQAINLDANFPNLMARVNRVLENQASRVTVAMDRPTVITNVISNFGITEQSLIESVINGSDQQVTDNTVRIGLAMEVGRNIDQMLIRRVDDNAAAAIADIIDSEVNGFQ